MSSLLNTKRPPIFCPGCAHKNVTLSLDKAFSLLNLVGEEIAIISDIGCSGLFDTFFNTHAMHGLHGRALTYATGIKMANPKINVITTMGDGGLGIGGTHFLAACRRNLDMTLLILNNFNFGMTGGQFSSTTPPEASVSSGFLNQLEKPIDACKIAKAAGAPYLVRCSSYDKTLPEKIAKAISYDGMAVIDIHGICPGRYTKKNKLTPSIIDKKISNLPDENGEILENVRTEYSKHYTFVTDSIKSKTLPPVINVDFKPLIKNRQEIVLLGSAGQRIVTAGELLCMAALTSGLSANQKNDYPITVLRGHSISNVVLSTNEIEYAGIDNPNIIIVIADEGIKRKQHLFEKLDSNNLVIIDANLEIPECKAKIVKVNFRKCKIQHKDKAAASLSIMAIMEKTINIAMLKKAIETRFKGVIYDETLEVVRKIKKFF